MAAQTWTTLQQACAIALTRQLGTAISTYDPLFVAMFPFATSYAEDRINHEIPFLGDRRTVTATSATSSGSQDVAWTDFTTSGATLSVPEQLYIVNSGTNVPYDRMSDDFIRRIWPVPAMTVAPSLAYQGGRYWATPDTANILIAPTPDAAYDVMVVGLYYPLPISLSNPTTYLSTNYPDLLEVACLVYLSGALTRNFGAQADEPKMAVSWESQFQALIGPARNEERRRRGLNPNVPMPPGAGLMPFGTLKLRPGVDVIETPTYDAAQLTASMLIRFYKGLPQKRGGWVKRTATTFPGTAVGLHGWADLNASPYMVVGTRIGTSISGEMRLFVNDEATESLNEITPFPTPMPADFWSLDNYGQVLIACIGGGSIYTWTPSVIAPAVELTSAPSPNVSIMVMSQVQMVVSLGSSSSGIWNRLLVRWSDAGDYTDWTPTASNQAGSYVVPQGSQIIGGFALGLTALIWTDVGVTLMVYQGLPFVFGFQPLATGCGLYGPRAFGAIGTRVIWLAGHGTPNTTNKGPAGFFQMVMGTSAPQPFECDVWDILVANADFDGTQFFFIATNEMFNEFELFFPVATSSPYYVAGSVEWGSVKYNFVENVWDYTFSPQLQRTAWAPVSAVGNPVGADITGLLQQHEIGYDADGDGMAWSWQTGDFDLAQGEEMILVDWIIPDFATNGTSPTINLTVGARVASNAPAVTQTKAVTPSTYWTPNFALRGRQFYLAADGSDLGSFNRLGAIRYRAAPDGRGP